MNRIDDCLRKKVNENAFQFGLSPLHSWIRFFEYFIHLSYRLEFKRWQARTQDEKYSLERRKRNIQQQFRVKLGLIIDKPRSGGSGTSNDGNTARKFFKNSEVSAEITGLNKEIIDKCGVILQCLASGCNIKLEEFKAYSLDTARHLVMEYGWYNMPPSVHKILIHGSEVIEHALLSIGELSEEAAESNNKFVKEFRRNNTRKMSRVVTNTDLLHRLFINSDPLITGLRKSSFQQKTPLPPAVQALVFKN